jgi:hypothetical protein
MKPDEPIKVKCTLTYEFDRVMRDSETTGIEPVFDMEGHPRRSIINLRAQPKTVQEISSNIIEHTNALKKHHAG